MANNTLRLVQDRNNVDVAYKRLVGELWSSEQTLLHSLHNVVSYPTGFKPELSDFCIQRYSQKGEIVFDPFCGRGTTALQANLLGRIAWASDINPLAVTITKAKTAPAALDEIVLRLNQVDYLKPVDLSLYQDALFPFYHPDTYRELVNLRSFIQKQPSRVTRFIELLAISRLHGHTQGFFSGYSFPLVSISPQKQAMINLKRRQQPDFRSVAPRIIKKASQVLRDGFSSEFFTVSASNNIQCSDARNLACLNSDSVDLIVTTPPAMNYVDYISNNWLEFWFAGINVNSVKHKFPYFETVEDWIRFVSDSMKEMLRITKPNSIVALEIPSMEEKHLNIETLDDLILKDLEKIRYSGKRYVVEEILINQQSCAHLSNSYGTKSTTRAANSKVFVFKCISQRLVQRR